MEVTDDLKKLANDLLAQYQEALEANRASGQLIETSKADVLFDGRYFTVEFNVQEYWKYLENGTKPHFPPIDAIENWVKVKGLVPTTTNGRKVPSTRQLAYLIAREISINGTEARHGLQTTLDNADDIISMMVDAIVTQLDKEIEKDVEESL